MTEGIISTQAIQADDPQAHPVAAKRKTRTRRKQTMVRFDPGILQRVDRAAERFGITRAAFIVSSTVVRLEAVEDSRE